MYSYYFVLLVVLILQAARIHSSVQASDAVQNNVPTSRQLISTTENDERGIMSFISGLVKKSPPLKDWLNQDLPAPTVMTKLDLDPDIGKSLASPNFKALSEYVDMFNKKNPKRKTSLIDTLKLRYNKDFLPLNLQTAKDSSDAVTKAMATKLQIELLEQWRSNKKTAVDVFKILKFNFKGGRFRFDKTRFTILDDYIKLLNAKNSHENTQMLSVLKTGFGGEGKLALILSSKMESIYDEMYATAFNYRNFLFEEWMNRDLDPMSVVTKVFLVEEAKVADVPAKVKAIVADYKPFYIKANSLDPDWLPKNVDPRRF